MCAYNSTLVVVCTWKHKRNICTDRLCTLLPVQLCNDTTKRQMANKQCYAQISLYVDLGSRRIELFLQLSDFRGHVWLTCPAQKSEIPTCKDNGKHKNSAQPCSSYLSSAADGFCVGITVKILLLVRFHRFTALGTTTTKKNKTLFVIICVQRQFSLSLNNDCKFFAIPQLLLTIDLKQPHICASSYTLNVLWSCLCHHCCF